MGPNSFAFDLLSKFTERTFISYSNIYDYKIDENFIIINHLTQKYIFKNLTKEEISKIKSILELKIDNR